MIAEFIDPAILGFILIGVMLFSIFVGFPISFTLIFLGFVFGYLGFGKLVFYFNIFRFCFWLSRFWKTCILFNDFTVLNGHDRTNVGCRTTLCFYGYYDGTSWINGKIVLSFPINVSKS